MAWKHQKPPGCPGHRPPGGVGRGGAAKGAKPAFSDTHQPSGVEKSAGHDVAREVRARIADRKFEILDRLMKNAIEGSETPSNQAGMYLINQIAGAPSQSVDVTSKGERMPGYVMTAPAEIEDAEAWATQHKPKAP